MITATREVAAPCERVWEVMAQGWTYTQWVVGNSRTRAVDADWPNPGASIRHSVGVWPLVIDDATVVERSDPHMSWCCAPTWDPWAPRESPCGCTQPGWDAGWR